MIPRLGSLSTSARSAHRLNIAPPYYYVELPKTGLKLVICDKPASGAGYKNVIELMDKFAAAQLRSRKARRFTYAAAILSEIAHVSETPLEPSHMLVKLVLAEESSIPQAISAHVYLTGAVPSAAYDTASIYWNDVEEIAEHEIWAMREASELAESTRGGCPSAENMGD
ncbi:hypothetical protein IEO21_06388 [Rhodonia placenta]|uniref:Uncharacterized protein n=2 Tax=Rhodonia placenta TaxID=104341 RepID=A0A8H7U0N7_9APHY|nr:hypothetical protein IEO21_06388 [Postia placenta]